MVKQNLELVVLNAQKKVVDKLYVKLEANENYRIRNVEVKDVVVNLSTLINI